MFGGLMVGSQHLLGTALARDHDTDAFEHFERRARAFGEKGIGAVGSFKGFDGAADEDHRHVGRDLFHAPDEFVAIHLGHQEVTQYQIDAAVAKDIERFFRRECGDYAVTTGFQEKFANGESLFIVVNAENYFSGPHKHPCYFASIGEVVMRANTLL